MRMQRTFLVHIAVLTLLCVAAPPAQGTHPNSAQFCESYLSWAGGDYLHCALRERGRAVKRGQEPRLDRCVKKLDFRLKIGKAIWGAACSEIVQSDFPWSALSEELDPLVESLSDVLGLSQNHLSQSSAVCAARKAAKVGDDLRCRTRALAKGARRDQPADARKCSKTRFQEKIKRIEARYDGHCPTVSDAHFLIALNQRVVSELARLVAPSSVRHKRFIDPPPRWSLPDSDGDGLSDRFERLIAGSDPQQKDSDRDGRWDALEILHHQTDPNRVENWPTSTVLASLSSGNAARSTRMPGPALEGEEGVAAFEGLNGYLLSPLANVATVAWFVCTFADCPTHSNELSSQVAGIAKTVDEIKREIGQLQDELADDFDALKTIDDRISQQLQTQSEWLRCKDAATVFQQAATTSAGSRCPVDDLTCLWERFTERGTEGSENVSGYFNSLWDKDGPTFDIRPKLSSYDENFKKVNTECRKFLTDANFASPYANELGADAQYYLSINPFIKPAVTQFRQALFFDTLRASLEAWFHADIDLKKDAVFLAWQKQNLAAVPANPYPTNGYVKPKADGTCATGQLLGKVGTDPGVCVEILSGSDEFEAWEKFPHETRFRHPNSVFYRTMGSLFSVCQAWKISQHDACSVVEDPETVGYHCQPLLCEPSRQYRDDHNTEITRTWRLGRDYLSSIVAVGSPITNSYSVYEPTRNTTWLRDPSLFGVAWENLVGPPTLEAYPDEIGKKLHGAVPAKLDHWSGGPEPLTKNVDGMMATALRSQQHPAGRRAGFASYLELNMIQKGGMTWPNHRPESHALGTCNNVSGDKSGSRCWNAFDCSFSCQITGTCTCEIDPARGEGKCADDSANPRATCQHDYQCMTKNPNCSDPSLPGQSATCSCQIARPNLSSSPADALSIESSDLSCAAGYRERDLLWVGGQVEGQEDQLLKNSWGYDVGRKKSGVCKTPMYDYFMYPYVRERDATQLGEEIWLDKLWDPYGYQVELNTWGHDESAVGLHGAWPGAPPYSGLGSLTFGLSCNWLNVYNDIQACDDEAWRGYACETTSSGSRRQHTLAQNDLNFHVRSECGDDQGHSGDFMMTFAHGNDDKIFDGLFEYMGNKGDTCLYPIENELTWGGSWAMPVACAGGNQGSEGCDGNASGADSRGWDLYRQCLNFEESPNCAHLGVQSPYMMAPLAESGYDTGEGLSGDLQIFSFVGPSGVASSTEMVVGYATNHMFRLGRCGEDFSSFFNPSNLFPGEASKSPFMTIQSGADGGGPKALPHWPVWDRASSGQICPGAVDFDTSHSWQAVEEDPTGSLSATECKERIAHLVLEPAPNSTKCKNKMADLSYCSTPEQRGTCPRTCRYWERCEEEADRPGLLASLGVSTLTNPPSSCCDDASCERLLESSLQAMLPSVGASLPMDGIADHRCKEGTFYKVDGVQDCSEVCRNNGECTHFSYKSSWCRISSATQCQEQVSEIGWTLYQNDSSNWPRGRDLLADAKRVPAGAKYSNAVCVEEEGVACLFGAGGPVAGGVCNKGSLQGTRCFNDLDCHDNWIKKETREHAHSTYQDISLYECARSCAHERCSHFAYAGASAEGFRECALYPVKPDDADSCEKTMAVAGWSVWPFSELTTWGSDYDCTEPGAAPEDRTCSRLPRVDDVTRFLELALLPTTATTLGGECGAPENDCSGTPGTQCLDGICVYPSCPMSCSDPARVEGDALVCMNEASGECWGAQALWLPDATSGCPETLCWKM